MTKKILSFSFCSLLSVLIYAQNDNLEKEIPVLMKKADIPGMSVAVIKNGQLTWSQSFGFIKADEKLHTTPATVYEAASLSKMVFAYGVLKLVDQGKIDLDVPLNKYLGNNYDVGDDARLNQITARRVLSHTSGFPNWRAQDSKTLPINFTPGEKFSYSGEGFVYLSKVVELITKMPLEDFIQQTVLVPLGMTSSSFSWQDAYKPVGAYRHNSLGETLFRNQGRDVNAAASLRTTVGDYATFVMALLNGTGLQPVTIQQMFTPQVKVNEKSPQVFWGLGVGLEKTPDGNFFWHWGDQGDSKAYITADIERKNAVVYFANSGNGLSISKEIVENAIGYTHPGIAWLNYERYDAPSRTVFKSILSRNVDSVLREYVILRDAGTYGTRAITEAQMNDLGYRLLRMKKTDEALAVFRQNTIDFRSSANVWDSYAEAQLAKGNKELAIKYYEKALELDPKNQNTAAELKKLKL